MKKIFVAFLFLISISGIAQSLNDYQYVVVPLKFDLTSKSNQYRLSTITKTYLNDLGFKVFYDNAIPAELSGNKCDKLFVDVVKVSSLLKVKLQVVFRDCWDKVIYTSMPGVTSEKEFEKAYPLALKEAFASMKNVHYSYNGKTFDTPQNVQKTPTVSFPSNVAVTVSADQLFAQPIANGFQLVDSTPKVVLKLVKTNQVDYYLANGEKGQGVVYKKDNEWLFDYYKGDNLVSEKLNIKF